MTRAIAAAVVMAAVLVAPVHAEPAPADDEPREPVVSVLLSVSAPTALVVVGLAANDQSSHVGFFTVVGGLAYGPSAGWIYAGRPWRGLATGTVRFVAATAIGVALRNDDGGGPGDEALGIAAIAYLGTLLFDLVGPPIALSQDHHRWQHRAMLVPTAHEHGGGLALVGQF